MEARVAVLEKIAASTEAMLTELRSDVKGVCEKQEADYRGLTDKIAGATLRLYLAGGLAVAAVLGVIAKGFKWI